MSQIDARGLHQFFRVEEDVVVATAVGVCRIADKGKFSLVDGFGGVNDTVAVVVVLARAVFVVIVPLSEDKTGVVRSVLIVVNAHGGVIAGVNIAALVNGVERVSVILKVERNEVPAHAGQVDVRDGQRLVGPSIIVA